VHTLEVHPLTRLAGALTRLTPQATGQAESRSSRHGMGCAVRCVASLGRLLHYDARQSLACLMRRLMLTAGSKGSILAANVTLSQNSEAVAFLIHARVIDRTTGCAANLLSRQNKQTPPLDAAYPKPHPTMHTAVLGNMRPSYARIAPGRRSRQCFLTRISSPFYPERKLKFRRHYPGDWTLLL
jgi:hypothetical protein